MSQNKTDENEKNEKFPINPNPNNKNLIKNFRWNFFCPILVAILLNLIVTIVILQNISNKLSENKDLTEVIKNLEIDRNMPIVENVGNILYQKFQPAIFSLIGYKKYIEMISQEDFLDIKMKKLIFDREEKTIKNFLLKYSSVVPKNKNELETLQKLQNNNDVLSWLVDPDKRKLEDLSPIQLKQLYLATNLLLLFKSNFEIDQTEPNAYTQVYGVFEKSELVFSYPLKIKEKDIKGFYGITNPSDCRKEDMTIPDFYYFKCRPWYKQAKDLSKDTNQNITITYPYLFIGNFHIVGITVCINIDITVKDDNDKDLNDKLILCADLSLSNIISVFDYMNNMMKGYFFVIRHDSEKPIYYPKIKDLTTIDDLIRYEFDPKSVYYSDELNTYQNVIKKDLIKKRKFKEKDINNYNINKKIYDEYEVYKNGKKMNYTVFPVSLNIAENENDGKFLY